MLSNLAILASDQGDYHRAVPLYEQALEIWHDLGQKPGIAASLVNLGTVWRNQGEYERAGESFSQALTLMRELETKRGVALTLLQIGKLAYLQTQPAQAMHHYREALAIVQAIGDQLLQLFLLDRIAVVAAAQGQRQRAVLLHAAEAQLRETLGIPCRWKTEPNTRANFGCCARRWASWPSKRPGTKVTAGALTRHWRRPSTNCSSPHLRRAVRPRSAAHGLHCHRPAISMIDVFSKASYQCSMRCRLNHNGIFDPKSGAWSSSLWVVSSGHSDIV